MNEWKGEWGQKSPNSQNPLTGMDIVYHNMAVKTLHVMMNIHGEQLHAAYQRTTKTFLFVFLFCKYAT